MTTGPEHYCEAERLADCYKAALADAEQIPFDTNDGWRRRMLAEDHARALLSKASIHATLALAAASAEPIAQAYDGPEDTAIALAWSKAIS